MSEAKDASLPEYPEGHTSDRDTSDDAPSSPSASTDVEANDGSENNSDGEVTSSYGTISESDVGRTTPLDDESETGTGAREAATPDCSEAFDAEGKVVETDTHTITMGKDDELTANRYKKLDSRMLGAGAYKRVFKAYNKETGCEVAWNEVDTVALTQSAVARFNAELGMLKSLTHPRLIKLCDVWRTKNGFVLITELATAGTLKQYMRRVGKVRLAVIRRYCLQISEGLNFLHSQNPVIMHRDLKCENLLVNGSTGGLLISDLGLSSYVADKKERSVLGTPNFMAPEQFDEDYNEKVDIYAFGLCVLEMVTQCLPYCECSNLPQLFKKVTEGVLPETLQFIKLPALVEFIKWCIARNPADRPTAAELLTCEFLNSHEDDNVDDLCNPIQLANTQVVQDNIKTAQQKWNEFVEASAQQPTMTTSMDQPVHAIGAKADSAAMSKRKSRASRAASGQPGPGFPAITEAPVDPLIGCDTDPDVITFTVRRVHKGAVLTASFPFNLLKDDASQVATELREHLHYSSEEQALLTHQMQLHVCSVLSVKPSPDRDTAIHLVSASQPIDRNAKPPTALAPPSTADTFDNNGPMSARGVAPAPRRVPRPRSQTAPTTAAVLAAAAEVPAEARAGSTRSDSQDSFWTMEAVPTALPSPASSPHVPAELRPAQPVAAAGVMMNPVLPAVIPAAMPAGQAVVLNTALPVPPVVMAPQPLAMGGGMAPGVGMMTTTGLGMGGNGGMLTTSGVVSAGGMVTNTGMVTNPAMGSNGRPAPLRSVQFSVAPGTTTTFITRTQPTGAAAAATPPERMSIEQMRSLSEQTRLATPHMQTHAAWGNVMPGQGPTATGMTPTQPAAGHWVPAPAVPAVGQNTNPVGAMQGFAYASPAMPSGAFNTVIGAGTPMGGAQPQAPFGSMPLAPAFAATGPAGMAFEGSAGGMMAPQMPAGGMAPMAGATPNPLAMSDGSLGMPSAPAMSPMDAGLASMHHHTSMGSLDGAMAMHGAPAGSGAIVTGALSTPPSAGGGLLQGGSWLSQ